MVLIATIFQHKQNKKIQEILCEKDKTVQMHDEVLKIYSTCEDLCDFLSLNRDLLRIFSVEKNFYEYTSKLERIQILIAHANNHAKLIFEDEKIIEVVGGVKKKFFEYINKFIKYNELGKIKENREVSWKFVEEKYLIKKEHYWELVKHKKAYEDFYKLWKDEEFLELEKMLKDMKVLFQDENFDKYFAPYVKIGTCK